MKACIHCGNPIAWLVIAGWVHLDIPGWLDCDNPTPDPTTERQ